MDAVCSHPHEPLVLIRLWSSLSLSSSYMFWLLTYHLSILVKLGSWLNEAWPKPEDFLFDPLIPGTLFCQQRYKGSLQPIAWVDNRILLDHLWFPGLSSISSLHGKDLLEDPRIIGNQAVHEDLTHRLVWLHIRCLTPLDNMPSIPAFIWPPVPMGRPIYVCVTGTTRKFFLVLSRSYLFYSFCPLILVLLS